MLDELKYPIFFLVAFGLIGYYAVQAWRLWDSRVARELTTISEVLR